MRIIYDENCEIVRKIDQISYFVGLEGISTIGYWPKNLCIPEWKVGYNAALTGNLFKDCDFDLC